MRERRSELLGGAGLAGESFETEWCRLGGGGKFATDCGESSEGVVVKAGVFLRAETYLETRSRMSSRVFILRSCLVWALASQARAVAM